MAVGEPHHIARKLDNCGLHPETDAEERQPGLARVANGLEHSFHTANAESAGHEHPVKFTKKLAGLFAAGEQIAGEPGHFHTDIIGYSAVNERFLDTLVAVDESGVLADDGDLHATVRMQNPLDHAPPLR